MYTILVNDDLSLTTSVRTALLRNNPTNEIQILWKPNDRYKPQTIDPYGRTYSVNLCYEINGVIHTETFEADYDLYQERVRFYISPSSVLFNNRGMIKFWLEITVNTVDEEVILNTIVFNTLKTTLFIDDNNRMGKPCPCNKDEANTIRITRGDSLSIMVTLTDNDGYSYDPLPNDVIYFRVKKSASASDVLIEKQIDTNTLVIELHESDTKNLAFGNYKYEIEVITENDDHYTVIKNAPFIITEELH